MVRRSGCLWKWWIRQVERIWTQIMCNLSKWNDIKLRVYHSTHTDLNKNMDKFCQLCPTYALLQKLIHQMDSTKTSNIVQNFTHWSLWCEMNKPMKYYFYVCILQKKKKKSWVLRSCIIYWHPNVSNFKFFFIIVEWMPRKGSRDLKGKYRKLSLRLSTTRHAKNVGEKVFKGHLLFVTNSQVRFRICVDLLSHF